MPTEDLGTQFTSQFGPVGKPPCRLRAGGLRHASVIGITSVHTQDSLLKRKCLMLSHNVFFTLVDDSPEAVNSLVAACHKYLKEHPGVVFFAAGSLANEFARPVNDRMFDVALHVVFKDKDAHDAYQTAPDHLKFIEEYKPNWKQVRVFDSWVD
jgi:hypothetical protein